MHLALASDHTALDLKHEIMNLLTELGHTYQDFGAFDTQRVDYPLFAEQAARAVVSGRCERGIIFCGTGVGMSIAANKIDGIRCVNCSEPYSAKLSRQHNDTNMLSLGARVVGAELAKMIAAIWLETEYEGGRHQGRVDLIADLEKRSGGQE